MGAPSVAVVPTGSGPASTSPCRTDLRRLRLLVARRKRENVVTFMRLDHAHPRLPGRTCSRTPVHVLAGDAFRLAGDGIDVPGQLVERNALPPHRKGRPRCGECVGVAQLVDVDPYLPERGGRRCPDERRPPCRVWETVEHNCFVNRVVVKTFERTIRPSSASRARQSHARSISASSASTTSARSAGCARVVEPGDVWGAR